MKPTARLYQCVRCHKQVKICSTCDRGNIYCGKYCATLARTKSLARAGSRYQSTFIGKQHHAARQARYRKKVTHQGSPPRSKNAPMESLENRPKKTEKGQGEISSTCCFCKNQVSDWLRKGFLRRRGHKSSPGLQGCPQAP